MISEILSDGGRCKVSTKIKKLVPKKLTKYGRETNGTHETNKSASLALTHALILSLSHAHTHTLSNVRVRASVCASGCVSQMVS